MEAYVYMALWFICGILMIFRFGKENMIFYWLGAFFLFMGGWWLADILLPVDLFQGPWPWVLRGVSVCALAAAIWAYYNEKKKSSQTEEKQGEDSALPQEAFLPEETEESPQDEQENDTGENPKEKD